MKNIKKIFIFFSLLVLSGCDNKMLLSALNQRQCNEVLAILQENGIEGVRQENGKQGQSIQVARRDFVTAVDLLRQYNLPSKEPVEIIQAFPGDSLVASPQAERARLLSLIEQRLQQSLLTIPGIINARVHVSYPLSSDNRVKQPQQVSSLVTYAGDESPKLLMNKIKLFLTNSFADTNFDNVSVVVVERPPLQHHVTDESGMSHMTTLLISITVTLLLVAVIALFLLWRQLQQKRSEIPPAASEEKNDDGIGQ